MNISFIDGNIEMRRLFFNSIVVLFGLLTISCLCKWEEDFQIHYDNSDAIILGSVVSVEPPMSMLGIREFMPSNFDYKNEDTLKKYADAYDIYKLRWDTASFRAVVIKPVAFLKWIFPERKDSLAPITIWTGKGVGDCGYNFQKGEEYLIWTFKREKHGTNGNHLYTSICTATALSTDTISLAGLKYLNERKK